MTAQDISTISTAITSLGMSVVFCFLFWKFITEFITKYITEEAKATQAALNSLQIAITKLTDKLDAHLSEDEEKIE